MTDPSDGFEEPEGLFCGPRRKIVLGVASIAVLLLTARWSGLADRWPILKFVPSGSRNSSDARKLSAGRDSQLPSLLDEAGAQTPAATKPPDLSPEARQVVRGLNEFTFDLYRQLSRKPGNLIVSPYAAATGLAMTSAGARGATAEEILKSLHVQEQAPHLHTSMRELHAWMNYREPGYIVRESNRLWCQKEYSLDESFQTLARENYGAEPQLVDFRNPEPTRKQINAWIAEQTRQRIPEFIEPGWDTDQLMLMLTTTVLFAGQWFDPFPPARPGEFQTGTETVQVPTMSRLNDPGSMAAVDGLKMTSRGYRKGFRMTFLLPDEIGTEPLARIEQSLSEARLEQLRKSIESYDVLDISIPKFRFQSSLSLDESLAGCGIKSLTSQRADLSGLLQQSSGISVNIRQVAQIDVNERGTEAAAVSSIEVYGAFGQERRGTFRADHPFLFLIHDNRTGVVLFIGRVVKPSY